MTRLLFATACLLGATAVLWMGAGFAGSDALAFTVTAVIGCVYIIGIVELTQFRRATATLAEGLSAGIFTPITIHVTCAQAGNDGDGGSDAPDIQIDADATTEAKIQRFQDAVDMAMRTGEGVVVRF